MDWSPAGALLECPAPEGGSRAVCYLKPLAEPGATPTVRIDFEPLAALRPTESERLREDLRARGAIAEAGPTAMTLTLIPEHADELRRLAARLWEIPERLAGGASRDLSPDADETRR